MAGPPPNERRVRDRDNAVRETIASDDKLRGPELPDDVLPVDKNGDREEWHPVTRAWWDSWRRSPQATRMMTGPDWDYLLDTALMHHQMWMSGGKNSERAAEIRIRVAEFGATPASRLRLRLEIEVPADEAFDVGQQGNVSDMGSARRARLAGTA